jgi:hypothetical protein
MASSSANLPRICTAAQHSTTNQYRWFNMVKGCVCEQSQCTQHIALPTACKHGADQMLHTRAAYLSDPMMIVTGPCMSMLGWLVHCAGRQVLVIKRQHT